MKHDPLLSAMRMYLGAQLYVDECERDSEKKAAEEKLHKVREHLENKLAAAERRGTRRPLFQRILVAVDGSATSRSAVVTAAELAEESGAALAIVNVLPLIASLTVPSQSGVELACDELLRPARKIVEEMRQSVPQSRPCETLAREGEPAEEILRTAKDWRADLIVMGSRGLGRVGRFVLGSTTDKVVRGAPVPVLVVTHDPSAAQGT